MRINCWLLAAAAVVCMQAAQAQDRVYRCGNEYTNDAAKARQKGCSEIDSANVTVIRGTRPQGSNGGGASARTSSPASATPAPRATTAEGRARDSDARLILQSELKKAEERKASLLRDYNNGEPAKTALEMRNPAFYNKRIDELKADIARADSDIAGIQRELQRLPAP